MMMFTLKNVNGLFNVATSNEESENSKILKLNECQKIHSGVLYAPNLPTAVDTQLT